MVGGVGTKLFDEYGSRFVLYYIRLLLILKYISNNYNRGKSVLYIIKKTFDT